MNPDLGGDAATEPLITAPNAQESGEARRGYDDGSREGDGTDYGDERPTRFVWVLTMSAGISGLLFGYDTGVISSTLVSVHQDLSSRTLTTLDKSLITASTSFFALLASPLAGYLADAIGRKRVIILASLLFIAGALGQAFSTTVPAMIIGRSVIGAGVGAASFVAPLYIGELAPRHWRGRLVTISILFITGGQVVAYVLGWALSRPAGGWRWMVGLGALPAAVQLLLLLFMPETARWLVKVGRSRDAEKVLTRVYGPADEQARTIRMVLDAIQREVREEEDVAGKNPTSTALKEVFHPGRNRRALVISCLLQASQQLCGFNSLMYFSAAIFSLVGFTSPTLTSLTIAVANFVFTLVAFSFIDIVGRRRILLWSLPWMVVGLLFCAGAFSFLDITNAGVNVDASTEAPRPASIVLLVSLVVYVSSYAIGIGNVPWQQSELFPLRVRSVGSSLSTATNWLSNTVVGLTFLPMMDLLTPTVTFVVYAAVCVLAWVGIWRCYPETAGLGLEDVGAMLDHGYGVQESMERWRADRSNRRTRHRI